MKLSGVIELFCIARRYNPGRAGKDGCAIAEASHNVVVLNGGDLTLESVAY